MPRTRVRSVLSPAPLHEAEALSRSGYVWLVSDGVLLGYISLSYHSYFKDTEWNSIGHAVTFDVRMNYGGFCVGCEQRREYTYPLNGDIGYDVFYPAILDRLLEQWGWEWEDPDWWVKRGE